MIDTQTESACSQLFTTRSHRVHHTVIKNAQNVPCAAAVHTETKITSGKFPDLTALLRQVKFTQLRN